MIKQRLFALLLALVPALALAAGGGEVEHSGTDLGDKASLQRGAGLFMNYCSGCHSLALHRYSRIASDLDLSPELVEQNLIYGTAKIGENIRTGIPAAQSAAFFGKAAPDLSLVSRSKAAGPDWVYTYLKSFYVDEARPMGWNNKLFPGVSMPNPLWELQGIQRPVYGESHQAGVAPPVERLELASPGRLSPEEFDQVARDLAAFLEYVSEPAALQRESVGVWVILFLSFLTFIAWLLKHEYWRDVH